MKIQANQEKWYENLRNASNSPVDTKSLVKTFESYNSINYYATGNAGSAAGSTKCCATGTCDNINT